MSAVPADIRAKAMRQAPNVIDVYLSGLPCIPGVPPASEWIGCGRYGASMHDDRHIPMRYSVLLVAHGARGWMLSTVRRNGECAHERAHAGTLHLIDIYRPHSLHHEMGEHEEGWVALCWERATKRSAERVHRLLCERSEELEVRI